MSDAFKPLLAKLADGGSGGVRLPPTDIDVGDDLKGLSDVGHSFHSLLESAVVLPLIVVGVVVLLALVTLLLWVSSRGKFIFLDNLVHNRAAIVEPWRRFASLGNSLFWWRVGFAVAAVLGFGVVALVVVGPAVALGGFEELFTPLDKKHKIYGGYWMHQDVLPQFDDRAIGMIGNSLNYAAGLQTPENIAFTTEFAKRYKRLPSWFGESAYSAGLWTKTAIDSIKGNVEDRAAFLKAMRSASIKGPRGPLKLDAYDNPIQNVYISKIQKIKHPVLGEVLTNVPVKTYEGVSQFWTFDPKEFLARGPYKR